MTFGRLFFSLALITINLSFLVSVIPSISPREIVASTPLSCSGGGNPCTGTNYPTCCSTNGVVFCAPIGSTCCSSTATYCSSSYPVCCQSNSSSANSYCLSSGSTCCGNGYYCPRDTTCISTSGGSKSPSYSCTTSSSGCFAGFETVTMDSGEKLAIKDVQVGDRILAYSSAKEEFIFSPVVVLLGRRRQKDNLPQFMQIWLDGGNNKNSSLTLTPDHLVLTGPCHYSDEEGHSFALKQAVKVLVGECIATASGQQRVIGSGYPPLRYDRSGYSVVVEEELLVVSDVIVSPFSVNHFFPNLFYYIHRYLYRHHRDVWLSLTHRSCFHSSNSSSSSSSRDTTYIHTPYEEAVIERMTATLSYLADIVKSYIA